MTMQLGSQTVVQGKTGFFNAPSEGLKGLIITNESPYTLSVIVGIGQQKTLNPETVDFFPTGGGFNGNVTYTPSGVLTNPTSYTANTITFDAVGAGENIDLSAFPVALTRPAVNPTATGQPIFSATYGNGNTGNANEILCVFNPANSGVIMTFHSARCFDSNASTDTINLQYHSGSDLNFPFSIPAVSHSGTLNPPVSVAHCTAADTASFPGGDTDIEIHNTQQNITVDLLTFPDSYILYPGGCLYIALSQTSTGHIVRLTLKWTENVITPPIPVTGAKAVASSIQNDGSTLATQWLEITPSGQGSSAIVSTVDGQLTWQVVSGGVYHPVLKVANTANFLRLGQSGDIVEVLGQALIDQLLTAIAGILVTGGSITLTGNAAGSLHLGQSATGDTLDTTATDTFLKSGTAVHFQVPNGTDQVKVNNTGLVFKTQGNIAAGFQMIGDTTIVSGGTSVSHSLGVVPKVIIPVLDAGASESTIIAINYGTASASAFTAYSSVASQGNVRFFVMG